jgi:hypothetical protein
VEVPQGPRDFAETAEAAVVEAVDPLQRAGVVEPDLAEADQAVGVLDQQRLGSVEVLRLDQEEGLAIDAVEAADELFEEPRVAVVVDMSVDKAAVGLGG